MPFVFNENKSMRKAIQTTIVLLLCGVAAPVLRAQTAPAKTAEDEAVRREERKLIMREKLRQGQEAQKAGRLTEAAKLLDDAYEHGTYLGDVVEYENAQTLSGLVATRMQLAEAAQKFGNLEEADGHVTRVLKVDPKNPTAAKFKAGNDDLIARQKGMSPSKELLAQIPELRQEKIANSELIQDGRFLMEAGKLDEAEAKLREAIKRDPSNKTADYYLKLVVDAKQLDEERKRGYISRNALVDVAKSWNSPVLRHLLPSSNPFATTNLVHTSKYRQAIKSKLDRIVIQDTPPFDGLALSEVVKYLREESIKRDPEKKGINFIVNSIVDGVQAAATVTFDPNTGTSTPSAPQELPDLNSAQVKIPTLSGVTLAQLLDAISKSTDQQIKISIEEYAVVFTRKSPEQPQIFTRTFRVNPNTFISGLEGVQALAFDIDTGSGGGGGGGGGGGRGGGGGGGRGGGGGGQGGGGQGGGSITTPFIPRVVPALGGFGQQGGGGGAGGGARGGGGGGFGGAGGLGGGLGGGGAAPGGTPPGSGGLFAVTTHAYTQWIQESARAYFTAAGVNFTQPTQNVLFFNDRTGILMVRASLADLEIIESAIEVLNADPPQVTIEAKFTEISQEDSKALGFDWFLGNTLLGGGRLGAQPGTAPSYGSPGLSASRANPSGIFPGPGTRDPTTGLFTPTASAANASDSDNKLTTGLRNTFGGGAQETPVLGTLTGIMTDPQFRMVLRALEQRGGADFLSAPRVTTLSGRQAQIQLNDLKTVVLGLDLQQNGAGGGGAVGGGGAAGGLGGGNGVIGSQIQYQTQLIPLGPTLDVIPYVSADGYSIQMNLIPSLIEFLGYDDPGSFVPKIQGAAGNSVALPLTAQQPLPKFRVRQITTSANVWDGQTIVLGGLIAENVAKIKDKVPVLGDIPLLGRLFRSESNSTSKKNLVVFVTPTLIDPAGNLIHTQDNLPFDPHTIPAQEDKK